MKPHTKTILKRKAAKSSITLIMAFLLLACENAIEWPYQNPTKMGIPKPSFIAGSEGGYFKALDGNVVFYFPNDALTENVRFRIQEGSEDEDADFVLRSILIEPQHLEFEVPVSISLRYDGRLANGQDPCKAKSLALYYFDDDKAFDMRAPKDMVCIEQCFLNTMDRCIETKIQRTGVYAIGKASLDPSNN